MSRATLQEWLLADRTFRIAYNGLEADAVRSQFLNIVSFRSEYDPTPQWPYLLFCASVLAPSASPVAEEKALRIAQSALGDVGCTSSERDAALIILDALSNRRSIQLAEERQSVAVDVRGRLGVTQSMDWMRRSYENRIDLADGRVLHANKFQRRFWSAAGRSKWLSVSAPTSAGKSYILAQWLTKQLSSKTFRRVVYVAPTRALVQQVEGDLRLIFAESGLTGVDIRTMPFQSKDASIEQEILVFTQERLHYYLQTLVGERIEALVIDEAHKLGDSHRGILLQDVIEQVTAANPDVTVLFVSPLTDNPEMLLLDAPAGTTKEPLRSDDATVNQNLLWLEPYPDDPKCWKLLLRRGESSIILGTFEMPKRQSTIKSKLATLAILTDTGEGGILVYANGAARAEDIAKEIAKRLPDIAPHDQVSQLDELCRLTIHEQYALREVLKKGVAFHYGNMPLLLRSAIEDLFRQGHIRYLVCTSTLVEGVNLPCRSIIIHAPKKGGTTPMTLADFWNLAGRAGRWGKEFQGNVICVDTQDTEAWGPSLPKSRGRYVIERTADRLLKDETRLVDHITAGSPSDRARSDQDLETAVSYLTAIRGRHRSLSDAPWSARINPATLARIDGVLAEALCGIDIPEKWIRRHAGISPFAMQRMKDALLNLKGPIDALLPIDPQQEQAAEQYSRIFEMLGHHMTTIFGQGGRCFALGILTTNWMLGHPIQRIISARLSWNKKKKIKQDIGTAIRKTLEDVEQIARFQAPRYLACYNDIVRHTLLLRGMPETANAIPDLTLSLEFGVRGPVQLGLMALGLSRASTLAIAEALGKGLTEDEISRVQAEPVILASALRDMLFEDLKLPALVAEEVRGIQSRLRD